MNIKTLFQVSALAFSIALANVTGASAYQPIDGVTARLDVAVLAPTGLIKFCGHNPAECRPSSVSSVTATSDLLALIDRVNRQVNRQITPRASSNEVWSVGARYGDCDDYVMTKRAQLIRSGVPAGALRIAATRAGGVGHAILIVKTNRGDYVLDNLHPSVRLLGETRYRILGISTNNPMRWTAG